MSPTKGSERSLDAVDLENGKPDFFPDTTLSAEITNDYLVCSRIVFDRDLDDSFRIALNGGHIESVEAQRRCWSGTGRAAYSAHCARVSGVESADEQAAQGFRDTVGCDKVVRIKQGFELFVDSR